MEAKTEQNKEEKTKRVSFFDVPLVIHYQQEIKEKRGSVKIPPESFFETEERIIELQDHIKQCQKELLLYQQQLKNFKIRTDLKKKPLVVVLKPNEKCPYLFEDCFYYQFKASFTAFLGSGIPLKSICGCGRLHRWFEPAKNSKIKAVQELQNNHGKLKGQKNWIFDFASFLRCDSIPSHSKNSHFQEVLIECTIYLISMKKIGLLDRK